MSIIKGLSIAVAIFIALASLVVILNAPYVYSQIHQLGINNITIEQLYLISFLSLFIASFTMGFLFFIMYWFLLGIIPTIIFLLIVLITKSSYLIEKIISIKKVATLFIILNAILVFLTSFYKG